MTSLPRLRPQNLVTLTLEPLTPTSFASFGTAIAPPLAPGTNIVTTSPPQAAHPKQQPNPQFANQQTALKTSPISPLINNYPSPTPSNQHATSNGLMSIFSCFPRQNIQIQPKTNKSTLPISILERHPYTTQTFCPFNYSNPTSNQSSKTYFLVVVAPTIQNPSSDPSNPPDLSKMRAFYSSVPVDKAAGMAVTYAAGTWHAPMIVLGSRRIDFLVTQHVNGIPQDDCQETLIGDEKGECQVIVDLDGLEIDIDEETRKKGQAKL